MDVLGARIFTADFADTFVKSLATPENPCAIITKNTESVTPKSIGATANPSRLSVCIVNPEYKIGIKPNLFTRYPPKKLVKVPINS